MRCWATAFPVGQLIRLAQETVEGRFRSNVPAFIGQTGNNLLGRQLPIARRVGDGEDFLPFVWRQFVRGHGQRSMATIFATPLLDPSLNCPGGQSQHFSCRLQSGTLKHGFSDELKSLLPF